MLSDNLLILQLRWSLQENCQQTNPPTHFCHSTDNPGISLGACYLQKLSACIGRCLFSSLVQKWGCRIKAISLTRGFGAGSFHTSALKAPFLPPSSSLAPPPSVIARTGHELAASKELLYVVHKWSQKGFNISAVTFSLALCLCRALCIVLAADCCGVALLLAICLLNRASWLCARAVIILLFVQQVNIFYRAFTGLVLHLGQLWNGGCQIIFFPSL